MPGSPMPTNMILKLNQFGGPKVPSLIATMIASHIRYALAENTDIDAALNVFANNAEELPLAWRPFSSPRFWKGACFAGEMRCTLDGDLGAWPPRLRSAVGAAVLAGREAVAAGHGRRVQTVAYAAVFAELYAADAASQMRARLARQLAVDGDAPLVQVVLEVLPALDVRAAMRAVRGATNAVITGARMQIPGAKCVFCHVASDDWKHFVQCEVAMTALCTAIGSPTMPTLAQILGAQPAPSARVFAAFSDFVSVSCATRGEVVARSPAFVAAAAAALIRAHIEALAATDAANARRRQARPRPRAPA